MYVVLANPQMQTIINLTASCLLGVFCRVEDEGTTVWNWKFLIPFFVVYLFILIGIGVVNYYREMRIHLIEKYEDFYVNVTDFLQEMSRKELQLYNDLQNKNIYEICSYYLSHDSFSEFCFFICKSVRELLQKDGKNCFRVMTFLKDQQKDEYYCNAFSPMDPTPEVYGMKLSLAEYRKSGIKKKDVPVHARPFLHRNFEPIIYLGEEVKKNYKNYKEDHPTKLHIGIPCTVNGSVVAVLQITAYESCLGSKTNINELIKSTLGLYVAQVKNNYVLQMQHQQIAAALNELGQIARAGNEDGNKEGDEDRNAALYREVALR